MMSGCDALLTGDQLHRLMDETWIACESQFLGRCAVLCHLLGLLFSVPWWVTPENQMRADVDSVSFVHRDTKGHDLAANVRLFARRKLDGNLAEMVGCEHQKPFHFPQFAPLFFTLTAIRHRIQKKT
jgi:hypothetical protein